MARIKPFLDCVAGGMRDIVRAHILAPVLFLSLLKLVIQAALIIALLKACHIELSTVAGLAVFVIGYLALCVPATPAGLGLYQVFVVAILGYFGVSKPEAASFSAPLIYRADVAAGTDGLLCAGGHRTDPARDSRRTAK